MTGEKFSAGDIYFARVKFEDSDEIKIRPVLILNETSYAVISLKMTSQPARAWDMGDYTLRDWKESGLSKQTVVRVSKICRLTGKDMLKKIGVVSSYDWYKIEELYMKLHNVTVSDQK
jgi:hypothetical protein